MKNVIVLDSYRRVYDVDNNLLHDAKCSEIIDSQNLSFNEACLRVSEIFNESKLLGSYTEIVSAPEKGVVEIKIEFNNKKILHRVIYLKDA